MLVSLSRVRPSGWGWCFVDETIVELPEQTPQLGPIKRWV
jgi:hypothetical protein